MRAWLDALRSLAPVDRLQALQEQLVRGVFLPADVVSQVTAQLADPLREQAQAFERASKAFAEIASLLRHQADLLDAAGGAVRAPADMVRGILGTSEPQPKPSPAKGPATKRPAAKRPATKRSSAKRSH